MSESAPSQQVSKKRRRSESGGGEGGASSSSSSLSAAGAEVAKKQRRGRRRGRVPKSFPSSAVLAVLEGRSLKDAPEMQHMQHFLKQSPPLLPQKITIQALARAILRLQTAGKLPVSPEEALRKLLEVFCHVRGLAPEVLTQTYEEGLQLYTMMNDTKKAARNVLSYEEYRFGEAGNLEPSEAYLAALQEVDEACRRDWLVSAEDPFADFKFSFPPDRLTASKRVRCAKCNKKATIYCPYCYVPVQPSVPLPRVTLPLQVDMLHHPGEMLTKSTGVQGCVLSPDFVHFYEHPDGVPQYDAADTVLLFPDDAAVTLGELDAELPGGLASIKRVVLVESTWARARAVLRHPNVAQLRHVKIPSRQTTFWREQEMGSEFLATLEAAYWFCVEFAKQRDGAYAGEFDDLMLLYAQIHGVVRRRGKPKVWTAPPATGSGVARAAQAAANAEDN